MVFKSHHDGQNTNATGNNPGLCSEFDRDDSILAKDERHTNIRQTIEHNLNWTITSHICGTRPSLLLILQKLDWEKYDFFP